MPITPSISASMPGEPLERLHVVAPALGRGLVVVRQQAEHPHARDVRVFTEVVGKEVDFRPEDPKWGARILEIGARLIADARGGAAGGEWADRGNEWSQARGGSSR